MRENFALVHVPGLGATRGKEQLGQQTVGMVRQFNTCRKQCRTLEWGYAELNTKMSKQKCNPVNRNALLLPPGAARTLAFRTSLARSAAQVNFATRYNFPSQARLRQSAAFQRVARDIHDNLVGKSESVTNSRRLALQYIRRLHPDKFSQSHEGAAACKDVEHTRVQLLHCYMLLADWLDDPEIGPKICGDTAFDSQEACQAALRIFERNLGKVGMRAVVASCMGISTLLGGIALRVFVGLGGLNYVAVCWAVYALESQLRTVRRASGAAAQVWDNPRFVRAVTTGVILTICGAGTAIIRAGLPFCLVGL